MKTTSCVIRGCDKAVRVRNLCDAHYSRLLRYGDATHRPNLKRGPDLTGMRFGLITVLSDAGGRNWECRCECGTVWTVRTWCLTSGTTTKCRAQHHRLSKNNASLTYVGAHKRLRLMRGLACDYPCADCRGPADEWSYVHGSPGELLSDTGLPYSADPFRYKPRCRSCHRRYDSSRKDAT